METVWQKAFNVLEKNGFDVYPPGIKKGECKSPYIVLKDEGANKFNSYSTNIQYYSVLLYVPTNMYSRIEEIKMNVKNAMKELNPILKEYGQETPTFYEDTIKAHMISIMYKNYRKN